MVSIKHIYWGRCVAYSAALYGVFAVIFGAIAMAFFSPPDPDTAIGPVFSDRLTNYALFVICATVWGGVLGFLAAFAYNRCAGWFGGICVEVQVTQSCQERQ